MWRSTGRCLNRGVQCARLGDARAAWGRHLNMIATSAEDASAHPRSAGKVDNRHSLQPHSPGCKQVEAAVPGQIVDARRSLKERDRPTLRCRCSNSDFTRHARDPAIVQAANYSPHKPLIEAFPQFHVTQSVSGRIESTIHQLLSCSYPRRTRRSPATSRNRRLCSGVKCSRQPPVLPERKVLLFWG